MGCNFVANVGVLKLFLCDFFNWLSVFQGFKINFTFTKAPKLKFRTLFLIKISFSFKNSRFDQIQNTTFIALKSLKALFDVTHFRLNDFRKANRDRKGKKRVKNDKKINISFFINPQKYPTVAELKSKDFNLLKLFLQFISSFCRTLFLLRCQIFFVVVGSKWKKWKMFQLKIYTRECYMWHNN